jgi:adenylate cyclase
MTRVRVGGWLVRPEVNAIERSERLVRLEPKVMELLLYLAARPGQTLARETLLEALWPDTAVVEESLTRCVSQLRRAFEDDPVRPTFIQTIPKRGYRLIAPVSNELPESKPAVEPPVTVPVPLTLAATRDEPAKPRRLRVRGALAAGIALVIGLAGGGERSATELPRIAILPFKNLGSPADELLSSGLADEVIARLSSLRELRVTSRTSTERYRGGAPDMRRIGAELGVDYVLEGSVLWNREADPDRVRVTAQLVRVADDSHRWAEQYDREPGDLLVVQSEIAMRVVRELRGALASADRSAFGAVAASRRTARSSRDASTRRAPTTRKRTTRGPSAASSGPWTWIRTTGPRTAGWPGRI